MGDRPLSEEGIQQKICDQFSKGIIGFDAEFRINYWNQAIEEYIEGSPKWNNKEAPSLKTFIKQSATSFEVLYEYLTKGLAYQTTAFIEIGSLAGWLLLDFQAIWEKGEFIGGYCLVDITLPNTQYPLPDYKALHHAFDNSQESFMVTDTDLENGPRILYVNPAFSAITGYKPEEIIGKTPRILQGPKTERTVIDRLKANLQNGEQFSGETVNYRKDGSEFIFQWEITPQKQPNGAVDYYVAVQRDVTEQRKVEANWQESERRFKRLFDNAPVALFIHDQGAFIFANQKTAELLGFNHPQDLLNKKVFDFVKEDYRSLVRERVNEIQKGNPVDTIELGIQKEDGSEAYIEVKGIPFTYKGKTVVQTIAIDITERKQAEEQIKANESFFRLIAENSRDFIGLHDLEANFIYASPSIENLTGVKSETIIGGSPYSFVHPEDYEFLRGLHQQLLEGKAVNKARFRIIRMDEEVIWVEVHLAPLKSESGEVIQFQTISRDVTEEQGLKELAEEMQDIGKIGGWNYNVDKAQFTFTKGIYDIYGLPYGTEIDKEKAIGHYDKADQETIRKAFDNLLDKGQPFDHELRFWKGQEEKIWVRAKGEPYYDDGQLYKIGGTLRDITYEKEAQLERDRLFNNSVEMIAIGDNGYLRQLNQRWREVLGWSEDELKAVPFIQFIHQEDQEAANEKSRQLDEEGSLSFFECRFQCRNGSFRWLSWNVVKDGENGLDYAFVRDITEQKRMEEELRESEEMFRAYADNSLVGVYVYQDGEMKYVNPKMAEITGYSFEETRKINPLTIAHPDDRAVMQEKIRLRESGQSSGEHYEIRFYTKDGQLKHAELFGSSITYKGKPAIIGTFVDITARKATEEKLKESEERFRNLTERSLVGVFMFKGIQVEYVNPKITEITGYSKPELLNNVSPLDTVHPEDYAKVWDKINERLSGDEREAHYEFRIITKQGNIKNVEVFSSRFHHQGEPSIIGTMLDVTERKQTEAQLIENQHFIQKVMDNSPNIIHVYDYRENNFVFVSQRLDKGLGYTAEEINEFPNGIADIMHPDDLERVYQAYQQNFQLKDGEVNEVEFRLQHKQGGLRWIVAKDTPFKRDENGELVQVLSSVQDMTEQKRKEQEIIEKQKFIESVAQHSPNIIHIFSFKNNDFIYENFELESLLGYSKAEVTALPNGKMDLYHPEDIPVVKAMHEKGKTLKEGEINEEEFRMKDKAGNWRWLFSRDTVFKKDEYGNNEELIGIVQDITEKKQAEESLKRNEALFRQLFQNAPTGIVILDADYQISNINEGFTQIFGYQEKEIVGKRIDEFIVPKGYEEEGDKISRTTMEGETQQLETVRIDKDGNQVPVLIYGVPVFLQNETISIFGIYVDIAQRKQAEEHLTRQSNELLRSNAELEQFAYVTSHNLRSPVINLQSLLQLFDESEIKSDENQYIYKKIHQSVEQLNDTLKDLVEIVAKKKEVSQPKEKVAFSEIWEKVKNSLNNQIEKHNAELIADFKATEIYYLRSFLESILQNLLTNSLKYRSEKRHPVIEIKTYRKDGFVCLVFTDNGVGIDLEANYNKLFNLYQRLHTHQSGKGMGLYIVKSQVESLGGKVEITSEVDKGTSFFIYLKDFAFEKETENY